MLLFNRLFKSRENLPRQCLQCSAPSGKLVNEREMQMTMFRYFDHDNNEWVDKAILIADGKLADANGVVIIKKGA